MPINPYDSPVGQTTPFVANVPARSRIQAIGAMYIGYAMFMVLRMIPAVAGPAIREDPSLDISLGTWGQILATGTCGAVLGKFIAGYAADKLGGKLTFAVGLLMATLFVGVFAAATAVWMFYVAFFFALMAKSAGWPAMAKIIDNWFRPNEYGRVWGVLSTSSRVGTLIATFCLAALLAIVSWRASFRLSLAVPIRDS